MERRKSVQLDHGTDWNADRGGNATRLLLHTLVDDNDVFDSLFGYTLPTRFPMGLSICLDY